ncbi:unnamed protein product, partial [Prorocentrum cordatum]
EDATKETKMATASDGRRRGGDGGNTAARAADWLDPVARLGESAARGTERQERTPLWTGFRGDRDAASGFRETTTGDHSGGSERRKETPRDAQRHADTTCPPRRRAPERRRWG